MERIGRWALSRLFELKILKTPFFYTLAHNDTLGLPRVSGFYEPRFVSFPIFTSEKNDPMLQLLYQLYQQHPVVCTDSRKVTPGSIFFALRGDQFDGNQYALSALAAGAVAAVVDDRQWAADPRCLLVDDVLQTLQQLALHHRRHLSIPVVGITGTNGKTTTKELIAAVLSAKYRTGFTKGNLNNHLGVPLTLLSFMPDDEIAVVEMGASHPGEIAALCAIAEPDAGLITNIGRAHLEGFGGYEGVIRTKTELYLHLQKAGGMAFVNGHDSLLMSHALQMRKITYGTEGADVCGTVMPTGPGLSLTFSHQGLLYPVTTRLIGAYNFDNVMAAVAVGLHYQVEPELIASALSHYTPSNHRSQWIETPRNQLVMDAYNANPSSMEAALAVFAKIETPRPKVLILGGMRELGAETEKEHQQLITLAAATGASRIIAVGSEFGDAHGFEWYADGEALALHLRQQPIEGALILVKGSRGNRLETLLPLL